MNAAFASVEAVKAIALMGLTPLRDGADAGSTIDSQIQFGEEVDVNYQVGEWFHCTVESCGFSRHGFIRAAELAFDAPPATHRIKGTFAPLLNYAFSRARVIDNLPKGSLVRVVREDRFHYHIWPRGAIFKAHLEEVTFLAGDYLASMRGLIGTPFVWGGRTTFGVDCAGFIQLGMRLAGLPCPRHKNDMPSFFGPPLVDQPIIAGDLGIFPKHCVVFTGDGRLMNSSAAVGEVVDESVEEFFDYMREKMYDINYIHLRPNRSLARFAEPQA